MFRFYSTITLSLSFTADGLFCFLACAAPVPAPAPIVAARPAPTSYGNDVRASAYEPPPSYTVSICVMVQCVLSFDVVTVVFFFSYDAKKSVFHTY